MLRSVFQVANRNIINHTSKSFYALGGMVGETVRFNSTKQPKTGVLLLNMGGPKDQDEVGSFLANLFKDRDLIQMPMQSILAPLIVWRRTPRIKEQYKEIGGGSPIYDYTNYQGGQMAKQLNAGAPEDIYKHYVAFRYVTPRATDALLQMKEDGIERVIAFTQYPQFSCTTTGSSLNELWRECTRLGLEDQFQWSVIDRWFDHPRFIDAVVDRVKEGLSQFKSEADAKDAVILFSAHSLPMKTVIRGDHYPAEVAATAYKVMKQLDFSNKYNVVWQSQVGKIPWLGPQTETVVKNLGATGHKNVLVVPIAFTSDHIETLFEIDVEFSEEAHKAGITQFIRAPSLNKSDIFVDALTTIVKDHETTIATKNTCHTKQYTHRCPECTKPWCRSIINPVVPSELDLKNRDEQPPLNV